jgi:signal transduction histidine kinase
MINDNDEKTLIEVGRMASHVIHDFKNQLSGLKLYAAYLQKRFADNAEGLEIAEKIVQGLNEMADQAAILSRLSRPLEFRMEPSDIGAVVKQAAGGFRTAVEAGNAKLKCEVEPDLPMLNVDAHQIRIALETIIARAVESAGEQGEVRITLKRQGAAVEIQVEDSGESLDENRFRSLFDALPGDRINKTSLGLAMARRIVEKHGGEIAARAASPRGTIVVLRLNI